MNAEVDLRQLAIERGQPAAVRPRRRHWLTRYVLPGVLLGGFAAVLGSTSWEVFYPPRAVTVASVVVVEGPGARAGAKLFRAAGWIEPRPTAVRVPALAPGVVAELLVVEDQSVRAGDPVAVLVKEDAQLALEGAAAELKLREAELEQAQAAARAAITRFEQPVHLVAPLKESEELLAKTDTQLRSLPFELEQAEIKLALARRQADRKQAAAEAVAGGALDEAQSEMLGAKALVAEIRQRLESLGRERAALAEKQAALQTQLELLADERQAKDEAAARVKAAAARVEQGRVVVAEAGLRLERMTVRAPVEGRVYQLVGQPGAALSGGMQRTESNDSSTVVTLYRPGHLQVRTDVRFEDLPQVRLGQQVEINNPALPGPVAGNVLFISSEADIQKNTLQVKVAISDPPAVFKPEMLVDVTFLSPDEPAAATSGERETRLYAPERVVHRDGEGAFVWVADQSARIARRVSVATGSAGEADLIEIIGDLTAASRLIAGGAEGLREGNRIRVTDDAAGGAPAAAGHESPTTPKLHRLPTGGNE